MLLNSHPGGALLGVRPRLQSDLQGEMSGLLGSMAGSWQMRQAGMDTVLDDVLSLPAIEPPPPIDELGFSRAGFSF